MGLDDAFIYVLYGHTVARKVDHLAPFLNMKVVETGPGRFSDVASSLGELTDR